VTQLFRGIGHVTHAPWSTLSSDVMYPRTSWFFTLASSVSSTWMNWTLPYTHHHHITPDQTY